MCVASFISFYAHDIHVYEIISATLHGNFIYIFFHIVQYKAFKTNFIHSNNIYVDV